MSDHRAKVEWKRSGEFRYETYSRAHQIDFEGIVVPGNAAPGNIPATVPPAPGVDPEQMLVGALSTCHMLWFLHLACQRKWTVDSYEDDAVGVLDKTWVSKVTLRPRISFSGTPPSRADIDALHHKAHERCYLANSVKTEVVIEPC
jgi:organic hydroperoxide reductase OsmC/OhrA